MKKLFLSLVFVFALMSFTESNTSSNDMLVLTPCQRYASLAIAAEIDAYGPMSTYDTLWSAYFYLTACEASGGSIDSPVFL